MKGNIEIGQRLQKDEGSEGFIYIDYVNNNSLVCAHNDVIYRVP